MYACKPDAARLYAEGKSVRKIAQQLGVTSQTVYLWLKAEGVVFGGRRPQICGRTHGKGTSKFVVYTVYRKKGDDLPIIVDGYAQECADMMGIQIGSFWSIVCKQRSSKYKTSKKWHVEYRYLDGKHRDDIDEDEIWEE